MHESTNYNRGDSLESRYTVEKRIAKTKLSQVYKAWDSKLQKAVVIKAPLSCKTNRYIKQEVSSLHAILKSKSWTRARNKILKPIDKFTIFQIDHIVYPLRLGTLHDLINARTIVYQPSVPYKKSTTPPIEWDWIKTFTFDILHIMKYLERNNIVHCDIKPGNIFLKQSTKCTTYSSIEQVVKKGDYSNISIQLADFGMAVRVGEFMNNGTPSYTGPEFCCYHDKNGADPDDRIGRRINDKGQYVISTTPRKPVHDSFAIGMTIMDLVSQNTFPKTRFFKIVGQDQSGTGSSSNWERLVMDYGLSNLRQITIPRRKEVIEFKLLALRLLDPNPADRAVPSQLLRSSSLFSKHKLSLW